MARKPKNQPSPAVASALPAEKVAAMIKTLAPARRGRKATAAASTPELPVMADSDDMAADSVEAEMGVVDPIKMLGRKAAGRRPKPSAPAAAQDNAGGRRGLKRRKLKAEATATPADEDIQDSEALAHADSAAGGDLAPQAAPDLADGDAHHSLSDLEAPRPVKPAAHWDRTTGAIQFDWPAIDQIASREGPNQGMAKLLVAARTEGASSRWPF